MRRLSANCDVCLVQMTSTEEDLLSLDHYVRKTFHKTASLMANSCKAIAILGGQNMEVAQSAWEYGRHVGLAFQVSALRTSAFRSKRSYQPPLAMQQRAPLCGLLTCSLPGMLGVGGVTDCAVCGRCAGLHG